jgi:hypothetical protein
MSVLGRCLRSPRVVIGGCLVAAVALAALLAPWIAPHDPQEQDLLATLLPPSWVAGGEAAYPLGTDQLGRCILSRLLFGARIALYVAVLAATGAMLLGTTLALLAGTLGGRTDMLVGRAIDVWMAFPPVILALILLVGLGAGVHKVILAIIVVDWTRFCRIIRSEVIVVVRRDYVAAARLLGDGLRRALDNRLLVLYRLRLPGHGIALSCTPEAGVEPGGARVERAAMAVLLDQPFGVVALDERADGVADLVDGLEDAAVDGLFFQRSEQPLDDAVRLGFGHEGVARRDAPEPDLLPEVVGHEVAAVVVAQRQAAGSAGAEVPELLADGHAERLGRLEAGAGLRHVPAEELGVPVLGDAEDPHLAVLDGGDLGGVDRPHDVRRRGDDVAVMRVVRPAARTVRREQGVLAHQAQDAPGGDADGVAHAQAGPDLAMALAGPGRAGEVLADGGEQGPSGTAGFGPRRAGGVAGVAMSDAGAWAAQKLERATPQAWQTRRMP